MNILRIEWKTGYLMIDPAFFFPCSLHKFKKVLKLIDLDWNDDAEQSRAFLKNYFQNQIEELTNLHAVSIKRHSDKLQLVESARQRVRTKAHPNGAKLSSNELSFWRNARDQAKEEARQMLLDAGKAEKDKQQFEKLLEELMK